MESRTARLLPFLAGSSALGLYLVLPSMRHNFDGVACAVAVELGDFAHLLHGNHLAYGLVGWVFHRTLLVAGIALPALWALQIMDSLLGALAVGLFARLLLRRGRPAGVAAAASMGLAVSYGWWLRCVDAQVYLLAAPFLVLAFDEALSDRPRALRLAALHTGAMLVHGLHVFFTPVAVWSLLRRDDEEGRAALGRYLAFCLLAVVAAYLAAAVLAVRPQDLGRLKLWLLGSAALGPGRTFKWLGAPTVGEALLHWAGSCLGVAAVRPAVGLGLWALAGWGWSARGAERERTAGALWIGSYLLMTAAYEPWNIDYRIMDLLPLWAGAAAAVSPARERAGARALAAYAALLGAVNLSWGILPVSRAETNRPLQKTLWLRSVLPADAWVCARSIEELYIPYFAHRRTLNLRWHEGDPEGLRARVAGLLAAGEAVYVTSDHLADGWDAPLAGFVREPAGSWEGLALYRLRPAPAPQSGPNGKPKGSR